VKRAIFTAMLLTLSPSLTNAEVSGKALIGIWMCEEASQGQGTISQLQFQENGHVTMDFSFRDMVWEYSDSPNLSITGSWSLNGKILIIQSESATVWPLSSDINTSNKKTLGEGRLVKVSNEPTQNLVRELSDESFVFVREGRNMTTRCIRKPQ